MDFPALPVAQSEYIVLGKVTAAEAHLSENKKNVYSEFKVSVENVLKTASSSIIAGTEITVDRIGGVVKYPNGRSVLYRLADTNMPAIGERYLLFLTSNNQQDISILTAYEVIIAVEFMSPVASSQTCPNPTYSNPVTTWAHMKWPISLICVIVYRRVAARQARNRQLCGGIQMASPQATLSIPMVQRNATFRRC
jgi:hypothetical protein